MLQELFPDVTSQNRNLNLLKICLPMKKQKPIQDSFCFIQKHNHMRKAPHQLKFNFSYTYLTDYGKFTRYLEMLQEFLRANMFWNMFFHMLGFFLFKFLFKGWTRICWSLIKANYWYENVLPLTGLLVRAPMLIIKAETAIQTGLTSITINLWEPTALRNIEMWCQTLYHCI